MKYENSLWWPDSETHLTPYGLTYQNTIRDLAISLVPFNKRLLAIDIGAHVGIASIHFSQVFKEVIAFEPNKVTYDCLVKNTEGLPVTCLNRGLSNKQGFITLNVNPTNTGNTVPVQVDKVDLSNAVQVSRLDDFEFPEPNLIKIDVEGFEPLVLEGAREVLTKYSPIVIVEVKGIGYSKDKPEETLDILKSFGYDICFRISHDYVLKKRT
jgi:FkbM family methyltransferase